MNKNLLQTNAFWASHHEQYYLLLHLEICKRQLQLTSYMYMYGQFLPQQYVINNHGPKISGTKKKDIYLKVFVTEPKNKIRSPQQWHTYNRFQSDCFINVEVKNFYVKF